MRKVLAILVAVGVVFGLLMAGCAPQPAPTTPTTPSTPTSPTTPTTPTTPTSPTTPTTPTTPTQPAAQTYKWVGQSHAGGNTVQHTSLLRVAENIKTASGGRIQMATEIGGGIAPATKEFDAVATGTLDYAVTCFMYWVDKMPQCGIFTMVSGGMSPMEAMAWFRDGGGYDLAYRMVDSVNMDVQLVDNGGWMGPPEIFLSTNKVLSKAGDIKGLKVRAAGDGAEILTKMGAATVMMPAGDVFEAMERGVVDAFEVSGATLNWNLGLQDAAKYIYLSGARQPYEYNPFIIRKSTWNKLPADLKAIISEVNDQQVVYLKEVDGDRTFPILIGIFEATSITKLANGNTDTVAITINTVTNETA